MFQQSKTIQALGHQTQSIQLLSKAEKSYAMTCPYSFRPQGGVGRSKIFLTEVWHLIWLQSIASAPQGEIITLESKQSHEGIICPHTQKNKTMLGVDMWIDSLCIIHPLPSPDTQHSHMNIKLLPDVDRQCDSQQRSHYDREICAVIFTRHYLNQRSTWSMWTCTQVLAGSSWSAPLRRALLLRSL